MDTSKNLSVAMAYYLTSLYMNKATPQTIRRTHRYFTSGYLFLAKSTPRIMTER